MRVPRQLAAFRSCMPLCGKGGDWLPSRGSRSVVAPEKRLSKALRKLQKLDCLSFAIHCFLRTQPRPSVVIKKYIPSMSNSDKQLCGGPTCARKGRCRRVDLGGNHTGGSRSRGNHLRPPHKAPPSKLPIFPTLDQWKTQFDERLLRGFERSFFLGIEVCVVRCCKVRTVSVSLQHLLDKHRTGPDTVLGVAAVMSEDTAYRYVGRAQRACGAKGQLS